MLSKRIGSAVLALISLLFAYTLAAQTEIHGRVHDPQGRPVKNAIVTVAGTATKAISDDKGEFAVPAPTGQKLRLQVEAAGYYNTSMVCEATDRVDIALTPRMVVAEEVRVVAPRLDVPVSANPAATSVVGEETIEAIPRAIAADEVLAAVPGVKVDNQANGERVHISIRGQGILTERGIRGIQVLLDGIPLSDATGFVPDLFDVDWAGVQELEVVRGPVAFLYGGGSAGGVIDIHTQDATPATHGGVWSSGGSNGFYKTRGDLTGTVAGVGYAISASRTAGDGYRQHTAFWGNNVVGKFGFDATPRLRLNALLMGTGYFNQNPEGLNWQQVLQDPRQPNPDALTFNEYQRTVRFTGALSGEWSVAENQRVNFSVFTRRTRFTEPVPSSVAHRLLNSPGGSVQYDLQQGHGWLKHHFSSGFDLDGQFIDEQRHPNLGNAVEGPDLLSNEAITQKSFAGYLTERVGRGPKWAVLASVRMDRIGNVLEDKLRLNGVDLSGERIFRKATGRIGITWNPCQEVGLYASWGQGFLPPATEELVANPLAFGGFNHALVPATSSGAEVGVRGGMRSRVYYDVALFRLDTKNDFERYRIEGRPLETFYGNAGQSRRYGVETSVKWLPINRLTLATAYTYSHFVYTKYDSVTYGTNLKGNWLPNSPAQQVFADAYFELPRGLFLGVGTEAFSRAYVDPTNQTWIDGYGLLNARVSKTWQLGRAYGTLSVNGRNLTSKRYIAFTEPDPDGNSYQPGPEREVFAGAQVRF